MITIFNRKELIATFSMSKQAQVREILSGNHVEYRLKVIDRNRSGVGRTERGKMGTLGQSMDTQYEYIVFVHKADLEQAKQLIKVN